MSQVPFQIIGTNCSVPHRCYFLRYANSKLYSFAAFLVCSARCLVGHICSGEKEQPVGLALSDVLTL